jgi:AhpD family alkylhydroperoxidase
MTVNSGFGEKIRATKMQAAALFKAAPEPMRAFGSLMAAASKDGALDARTKELMALAIAIVSRCEGCLLHHVEAAMRHGADRQHIVETIAVSVEMGGGPATVYGGMALAAFDELSNAAS